MMIIIIWCVFKHHHLSSYLVIDQLLSFPFWPFIISAKLVTSHFISIHPHIQFLSHSLRFVLGKLKTVGFFASVQVYEPASDRPGS